MGRIWASEFPENEVMTVQASQALLGPWTSGLPLQCEGMGEKGPAWSAGTKASDTRVPSRDEGAGAKGLIAPSQMTVR